MINPRALGNRCDFVAREEAAAGVCVVAVGEVVRHLDWLWIADLCGGRLGVETVAAFAERVAETARRAVELEEEAAQAVGAHERGGDFPAPVEAEEVVVQPVGQVEAGDIGGAFAKGELASEARAV